MFAQRTNSRSVALAAAVWALSIAALSPDAARADFEARTDVVFEADAAHAPRLVAALSAVSEGWVHRASRLGRHEVFYPGADGEPALGAERVESLGPREAIARAYQSREQAVLTVTGGVTLGDCTLALPQVFALYARLIVAGPTQVTFNNRMLSLRALPNREWAAFDVRGLSSQRRQLIGIQARECVATVVIRHVPTAAQIRASGDRARVWIVPSIQGDSYELDASLDGRPVVLEPGARGRSLDLSWLTPGSHELRVQLVSKRTGAVVQERTRTVQGALHRRLTVRAGWGERCTVLGAGEAYRVSDLFNASGTVQLRGVGADPEGVLVEGSQLCAWAPWHRRAGRFETWLRTSHRDPARRPLHVTLEVLSGSPAAVINVLVSLLFTCLLLAFGWALWPPAKRPPRLAVSRRDLEGYRSSGAERWEILDAPAELTALGTLVPQLAGCPHEVAVSRRGLELHLSEPAVVVPPAPFDASLQLGRITLQVGSQLVLEKHRIAWLNAESAELLEAGARLAHLDAAAVRRARVDGIGGELPIRTRPGRSIARPFAGFGLAAALTLVPFAPTWLARARVAPTGPLLEGWPTLLGLAVATLIGAALGAAALRRRLAPERRPSKLPRV